MRISKHPSASSSSSAVAISATWMAAWIVIVGSWSCHSNVCAFAFPKIPESLLDDRRFHSNRRKRHRTILHTRQLQQPPPPNTHSVRLLASAQDANTSKEISIPRARLLLGLVAMLYGSLNVSLRFVYDVPDIPPTAAALSATRGWLAVLCFLPPLLLRNRQNSRASEATSSSSLLRSGLELAVWGFLAQGLLNVGLATTGSARASFLTQTSVLFTPLLSTTIGKESISPKTWLACGIALAGLVVLTNGAGGAAMALSLSRGDCFVLGGALSWSLYLFRMAALGSKHPSLLLQGVKTGGMAILYSLWWVGTTAATPGNFGWTLPPWMAAGWVVWISLLFSALGPGTIADVLQQRAQTAISPSETNILLSAEPIFATIFAVLLLGERSSVLELLGGALILGASVVASA